MFSSSSSSRKSASSGRNRVKTAAKSVAGVFIACFNPPEAESSNTFDVSVGGSEKDRHFSHEIYRRSNSSTHTKPGSVIFTMAEIYKVTKNFSPTLKIGQGGFGTVYRATLADGTVVAIKRAKKNVYENHVGVEFKSEVQTLTRVEHLNLVKFYGFLEHDDEKVIVVEYVPNGTLRDHLDCISNNVLDLAARLDIAIDVAHAVTYLHMYTDHPIIHRDIKSSNILLTENLRAKVADFGFARLGADSDSGATHVSTQVKGTAGYLDPEYLRTYQLTEKSDVYSFGVLLVELVTGRRPIEPKKEPKERITTRWAIKKFNDGDAISTMDPRLERSEANNFAVEKVLDLSLQCLAPHRYDRPTMRRCAKILWTIRKDYKEIVVLDPIHLSSHSVKSSSVKSDKMNLYEAA